MGWGPELAELPTNFQTRMWSAVDKSHPRRESIKIKMFPATPSQHRHFVLSSKCQFHCSRESSYKHWYIGMRSRRNMSKWNEIISEPIDAIKVNCLPATFSDLLRMNNSLHSIIFGMPTMCQAQEIERWSVFRDYGIWGNSKVNPNLC